MLCMRSAASSHTLKSQLQTLDPCSTPPLPRVTT
jgi:hypothetical protein